MSTVKLYKSPSEREHYETLADLYSIFIATENLERLYVRDVISPEEYTPSCQRLISQYKTIINSLGGGFDVRNFLETYNAKCPAAVHRLVDIGVPATTEHTSSSDNHQKSMAKYVAEVVQHFITLMDSLKLNLVAVDQLHPLLGDLMQSVNKITNLPSDYQGKVKIKNWLIELNRMKASDELSSEQVRQLLFDLESAHTEFYRHLSEK